MEKSVKRKAPPGPDHNSKRTKNKSSSDAVPPEEKYHIVDREFYPPEMANERCHEYINDMHPRPIELLDQALIDTQQDREKIKVRDSVVHWFKCDLRTKDNKALHLASEKAQSKGVPLICLYLVSPQDFKAHMTSPVRVVFHLHTPLSGKCSRKTLAKLDIPLYVETVAKRKQIPERIFQLCSDWGANHLFANIEYEVDELRREASMVRAGVKKGVAFSVVPDTCVVAPGELSSGSGNQYAVYSPWFRAWIRYLHEHPDQLDLYPQPSTNPGSARQTFVELFKTTIPDAPAEKSLTSDEKSRFRSMWPPGEDEAHQRLSKFLSERVGKYGEGKELSQPWCYGFTQCSFRFWNSLCQECRQSC